MQSIGNQASILPRRKLQNSRCGIEVLYRISLMGTPSVSTRRLMKIFFLCRLAQSILSNDPTIYVYWCDIYHFQSHISTYWNVWYNFFIPVASSLKGICKNRWFLLLVILLIRFSLTLQVVRTYLSPTRVGKERTSSPDKLFTFSSCISLFTHDLYLILLTNQSTSHIGQYYVCIYIDKVLRDRIRFILDEVNAATSLQFMEIPEPPDDDNKRYVFFINRRGALKCVDYTSDNFTGEGVQVYFYFIMLSVSVLLIIIMLQLLSSWCTAVVRAYK